MSNQVSKFPLSQRFLRVAADRVGPAPWSREANTAEAEIAEAFESALVTVRQHSVKPDPKLMPRLALAYVVARIAIRASLGGIKPDHLWSGACDAALEALESYLEDPPATLPPSERKSVA